MEEKFEPSLLPLGDKFMIWDIGGGEGRSEGFMGAYATSEVEVEERSTLALTESAMAA